MEALHNNRNKTEAEFNVWFNFFMLKKYETNFIKAKKIENYMNQFKNERIIKNVKSTI
jgi:hypothetical protein